MPDVTEAYQPVDRAPDQAWRRRFRFASLVCLAAGTIVAVGVAAGEILDIRWLTAGPRAWAVRPVPAPSLIASLMAIVGLWLALFSGGRWVGVGRSALGAVVAAGVSWLFLTFWGIAGDPAGVHVPASSAAFGLAVVALAGLLVSLPRGAAAGQIVALLAGTVTTVPLLGYALGARALVGFPFGFGVISIPTIAILLLLTASIALARPDSGVIDVATARSPGGVVLRRLLVPVLALPPVLIIAISAGEAIPLRTLAWVGSVMSALGVISLVATAHIIERIDDERRRASDERMAIAVGLTQNAELVAQVVDAQGLVGPVPDTVSVGVRRVAAEGVVGGDAYALVGIGGDRTAVVLVDIASKGAAPSVVAIRLRDSVTSALQAGLTPARALDAVSWLVAGSGTMATAFVGIVDPGAGEMVYASAGHVPGLRGDADGVHLLERTGPLLHTDVTAGWAEATCPIAPGDSIFVYTDGIADVIVRPGGGTSIEAFVALVEECPHSDPERVVSWCFERLEASPEWVLEDDATLIVVGVEGRHRRGRGAEDR